MRGFLFVPMRGKEGKLLAEGSLRSSEEAFGKILVTPKRVL